MKNQKQFKQPQSNPSPLTFDGTHLPEGWNVQADLQRRAQHPMKMSEEYHQAIAACEKALAAQRRAVTPRQGASFTIDLEPQHYAWGVAVLILIGLFLWLSLSVAEAAWSLVK